VLKITGGSLPKNLCTKESIIIAEPIRVSMPKIIISSVIKTAVTRVTNIPEIKTIMPLLNLFLLKEKQKPEIKINVQHILCCQIYA
jgi:hypothetical protein